MNRIILLLVLISQISIAQNLKQDADKAFSEAEYTKASSLYAEHLLQNPGDSSALYNLGYSALQLKDYKKAIDYLQSAENQNFPISFTTISKAKAYIGLNNKETALETLRKGANNGAASYMHLKKDSVFDVLRANKSFEEALELTKLNAYPCLKAEERRHFDFWLGEWEVFVNGSKVGDNSITLANGGCVINESYTTGMRNYTGQSMNYYDPQDKKWHQIWVGSGGGVLDYVEIDKAEGMLRFQCDFLNQQGNISYSRLTFTANKDGTVRQYFENSTDGENWTPGFDGLYKKKSN